jgi:N-methylhydantoinase B/oxoprolinase/acetone carboxylase alpha subunit
MGILRKGTPVELKTMSSAYIQPGDIVWTKSGGGGGVGDPLEREPEKVRWDLMNEYITQETALQIYGVVIDPQTFLVDEEATRALRKKRKAAKPGEEV